VVLADESPRVGPGSNGLRSRHALPRARVYQFSFIPKADKDAAISARSGVTMHMRGRHEHILRDRKMFLRFLRAAMGEDGVVAVDLLARRVWTRDELDIELSHDADLDVEGVLSLDSVKEDDDRVFWLHTHGLSGIGAFDFSIFDPSPEVLHNCWELARLLAFSALEAGSSRPQSRFKCFRAGIR